MLGLLLFGLLCVAQPCTMSCYFLHSYVSGGSRAVQTSLAVGGISSGMQTAIVERMRLHYASEWGRVSPRRCSRRPSCGSCKMLGETRVIFESPQD